MDTQETEITEEGQQETEEDGQETEEEGPGLQGNKFGARRKTNRKGKKNKKKKKKRDPGAAMLSCLAPLQLVAHYPDGSTEVVWENDLCNSALGGEF